MSKYVLDPEMTPSKEILFDVIYIIGNEMCPNCASSIQSERDFQGGTTLVFFFAHCHHCGLVLSYDLEICESKRYIDPGIKSHYGEVI